MFEQRPMIWIFVAVVAVSSGCATDSGPTKPFVHPDEPTTAEWVEIGNQSMNLCDATKRVGIGQRAKVTVRATFGESNSGDVLADPGCATATWGRVRSEVWESPGGRALRAALDAHDDMGSAEAEFHGVLWGPKVINTAGYPAGTLGRNLALSNMKYRTGKFDYMMLIESVERVIPLPPPE